MAYDWSVHVSVGPSLAPPRGGQGEIFQGLKWEGREKATGQSGEGGVGQSLVPLGGGVPGGHEGCQVGGAVEDGNLEEGACGRGGNDRDPAWGVGGRGAAAGAEDHAVAEGWEGGSGEETVQGTWSGDWQAKGWRVCWDGIGRAGTGCHAWDEALRDSSCPPGVRGVAEASGQGDLWDFPAAAGGQTCPHSRAHASTGEDGACGPEEGLWGREQSEH